MSAKEKRIQGTKRAILPLVSRLSACIVLRKNTKKLTAFHSASGGVYLIQWKHLLLQKSIIIILCSG